MSAARNLPCRRPGSRDYGGLLLHSYGRKTLCGEILVRTEVLVTPVPERLIGPALFHPVVGRAQLEVAREVTSDGLGISGHKLSRPGQDIVCDTPGLNSG